MLFARNILRKEFLNKSQPLAVRDKIHFSYSFLHIRKSPWIFEQRCSHLSQQIQDGTQRGFSTSAFRLKTPDYYKLLRVQSTAPIKDIKTAYYELAKQYHPDINKNDPTASRRFQEVSDAYELLSDDQKRAEYDATYKSTAVNPQSQESYPYSQEWEEEFWGNVDLEKEFEHKFGKFYNGFWDGQRKSKKEFYRNEDYSNCKFVREKTVKITFKEAAKGIKKEIKLSHPLYKLQHRNTNKVSVLVDIAAGIQDKDILRVVVDRSLEILVTVRVEPSQHFRRKGANIYSSTFISPSQSRYGGTIHIDGLYEDLNLEIPRRTGTHSTYKLSGRGFRKTGTRKGYGDHFVFLKVAWHDESRKCKRWKRQRRKCDRR